MDGADFNFEYQINTHDYSIDDLEFESFSSGSYSSDDQLLNTQIAQNISYSQKPAKQQKTCPSSSSSSSYIISFENSTSSPATNRNVNCPSCLISTGLVEDQNGPTCYKPAAKNGGSMSRSFSNAQDHVLAERNRRQKLNQRFVALSAIVPGLKKMDKVSILEDAMKYMRHLQERVNTLEEQAANKTLKSVVFVKKSPVNADDDLSSTDENFDGSVVGEDQSLPEIEARVSDKDILIKIHCEKYKGCVPKILNQVEKLDLNVINNSILAFGNSTLDVTIVAQMGGEFSMTMKDLVRSLRQSIQNYQ